ncbi:MAG: RDD family protein [Bdellovibrionota bacterium]|nr:RDD family protein [Bdellovibrionota bacterium]
MQEQDQDIDKILENFEFSAITDGLGFHHSVGEEKKVERSLAQKANELDQDLKKHINSLKQSKPTGEINRGDLTPFYVDSTPEQKPIEELADLIPEEKKIEIIKQANSAERSIAWTIDMIFVGTLAVATTVLSFFFADIPVNEVTMFSELSATFSLAMLSLYHILYFSVLDSTEHSTFGKRIFGIKVVKNLKPISLTLSFKRNLFCLVSLILIGLPAILKTQDLFFETQVIKR